MSLVEGWGIAESVLLGLIALGKFVYGNLVKQIDELKADSQKREDKIELRLEKIDDRYRSVTRELYKMFNSQNVVRKRRK